jgi:hypothetical protein
MFRDRLRRVGERTVKLSQIAGALLVFGGGMLGGILLLEGMRAYQRTQAAAQLCSNAAYVATVQELLTRELVYHGQLPPERCPACGDPASYPRHVHRDRIEPDCGVAPVGAWPSAGTRGAAGDSATVTGAN